MQLKVEVVVHIKLHCKLMVLKVANKLSIWWLWYLGTGNRVMQDISKGNFVESAGAKGSTRGREREEANGW